MKILIICPTLDFSKPYSATPFLQQLFKGLYEEGNELHIIPYSGKSIKSKWWHAYENPNYLKGEFVGKILNISRHSAGKKNLPSIPFFARKFAIPNLKKLVKKIFSKEKDIEAIINIALPLNQLTGFVTDIKKAYNIPILYYDVDLPTSLPEHGGFTFNYYVSANLKEYDSFIITSEGSASKIKELGANSVDFLHIGVDPEEYSPLQIKKDIDFFFFGHGGTSRKNYVKMMITEPSKQLNYKFVVGGRDYKMDIGNAKYFSSEITFPKWKEYACRSKVNLNVVHELHAKTFATSTARIFELAAMGCCIVSSPYSGLEKWFDTKKEIFEVNSTNECIEVYQTLMTNPELRKKMGFAAQQRVKKEHTSRQRARQMIEILKKYV